MKKLKASEITEPGYYWNIKAGVPVWCVREPRTGMHFRTFNGVSIAAKDIGENLIFIKAEPPKACRWDGYIGTATYVTARGEDVFFLEASLEECGNKCCHHCVGCIEIEDREG